MAAARQEDSLENSGKAAGRMFSKGQLVNSGKFAGRRDLLATLLEEGEQYSVPEVEKMIEKFMKGKVK